jgi:hypothetical protein
MLYAEIESVNAKAWEPFKLLPEKTKVDDVTTPLATVIFPPVTELKVNP